MKQLTVPAEQYNALSCYLDAIIARARNVYRAQLGNDSYKQLIESIALNDLIDKREKQMMPPKVVVQRPLDGTDTSVVSGRFDAGTRLYLAPTVESVSTFDLEFQMKSMMVHMQRVREEGIKPWMSGVDSAAQNESRRKAWAELEIPLCHYQ